MTPGDIYALDIQIDCCAWRFAAGHCIRLAVSSADWPNVWPTPELGTNSVHYGQGHPSRLILPIVPAQSGIAPPSFNASSVRPAPHAAAPRPPTWQVNFDMITGSLTATIGTVREQRVDAATVIQRENSVVCQLDPRDPARASVHGRATHRLQRTNSVIEGYSDVLIQATPTHFQTTIVLDIRVNDAPYHSRRWTESIPRQLL
jgi:hypothetical protein